MKSLALTITAVCALALPVHAGSEVVRRDGGTVAPRLIFEGDWVTTYGVIVLERGPGKTVTGTYDHGGGGRMTGSISGRTVYATYDDAQNKGDMEFSLGVDGESLHGRFRIAGTRKWHDWLGFRRGSDHGFGEALRECDARAAPGSPHPWTGVWQSTYGKLILSQVGDTVTGSYPFQARTARVTARVAGRCLAVQYIERDAAGLAVWVQDASGNSFRGVWKAYGVKVWSSWVGKRAATGRTSPRPKRP